ncbi:MAG: hypothetical protein K9L66_00020 [Spirochaetaceae bacterium]|nr:hypothetical protein [Spirochaetaceae bacterium]MCF7949623.1 hypothetical protein [Spirochaetia bacterium]MCF7949995.1 hypothetical protein [Spirochaetaceae bacterium]
MWNFTGAYKYWAARRLWEKRSGGKPGAAQPPELIDTGAPTTGKIKIELAPLLYQIL